MLRKQRSQLLTQVPLYRQFGRPVRLLLVEDNPNDVTFFKYGLQEVQAEYSLQIAPDGEKAAELLRGMADLREGRPDLILLDLNLPKRSGHEVLRMIRADPQLKLIPVIILTSSISRSDILAAYEAGANSYLQKPYDIDGTLDLMRTLEHYWLDLAFLPGAY